MGIWRSYAWILLGGAGFAAVIHLGSFMGFIIDPQKSYYRAWEWYEDFPYRSRYFTGAWDREEQGDLANSYLFLYDQKHKVRVSTDRFGFRRSAQYEGDFEVAVTGDSTIWGSGLSDDETLPNLLAQEIGRGVFNASRTSLDNGLKHPAIRSVKIVVDARTERNIRASRYPRAATSSDVFFPLVRGGLSRWQTYFRVEPGRYSPLARLPDYYRRARKDLDAIRSGKANEQYLFLRHRFAPTDLPAVVPMIVARHRRFTERGIRYIFVPIPAKQTLYRGDVDVYTRNYLPRLHQALRAEGVETVDLLESFFEHKDKGLYQPFDTHWNAHGTRLAAQVISSYLRGK